MSVLVKRKREEQINLECEPASKKAKTKSKSNSKTKTKTKSNPKTKTKSDKEKNTQIILLPQSQVPRVIQKRKPYTLKSIRSFITEFNPGCEILFPGFYAVKDSTLRLKGWHYLQDVSNALDQEYFCLVPNFFRVFKKQAAISLFDEFSSEVRAEGHESLVDMAFGVLMDISNEDCPIVLENWQNQSFNQIMNLVPLLDDLRKHWNREKTMSTDNVMCLLFCKLLRDSFPSTYDLRSQNALELFENYCVNSLLKKPEFDFQSLSLSKTVAQLIVAMYIIRDYLNGLFSSTESKGIETWMKNENYEKLLAGFRFSYEEHNTLIKVIRVTLHYAKWWMRLDKDCNFVLARLIYSGLISVLSCFNVQENLKARPDLKGSQFEYLYTENSSKVYPLLCSRYKDKGPNEKEFKRLVKHYSKYEPKPGPLRKRMDREEKDKFIKTLTEKKVLYMRYFNNFMARQFELQRAFNVTGSWAMSLEKEPTSSVNVAKSVQSMQINPLAISQALHEYLVQCFIYGRSLSLSSQNSSAQNRPVDTPLQFIPPEIEVKMTEYKELILEHFRKRGRKEVHLGKTLFFDFLNGLKIVQNKDEPFLTKQDFKQLNTWVLGPFTGQGRCLNLFPKDLASFREIVTLYYERTRIDPKYLEQYCGMNGSIFEREELKTNSSVSCSSTSSIEM